jgi:hypothetical protein
MSAMRDVLLRELAADGEAGGNTMVKGALPGIPTQEA